MNQASFSYRNQRHTNAAITYLLHLIMQLTQYTDGAQNLLNLENQIRYLIEGKLPRSLISVETVAGILTNITDHLEKYNVPLYLVILHRLTFTNGKVFCFRVKIRRLR
jgi:hypothetical protein